MSYYTNEEVDLETKKKLQREQDKQTLEFLKAYAMIVQKDIIMSNEHYKKSKKEKSKR